MIQFLLKKIQGAKATKKKSKGVAYWATTVAAVLGFLVVAYYAYQLFSGNTKLAKALHSLDVLKEDMKQAKVNVRVENNNKEKRVLLKKAKKLGHQITESKKQVNKLKKKHKANEKVISQIKDWDDVKMVKYSS